MCSCFDISEAEDRDMSCMVSSLVQVMCDPHCRTQHGFQSLVQKEWVTAGHRFYSRINYQRDNDKEEVRGRNTGTPVCYKHFALRLINTSLLLSFFHFFLPPSTPIPPSCPFLPSSSLLWLFCDRFLHPSLPVGSSLPSLPGLRLAALVTVSVPLPTDRWLPVGSTWQHPPATFLQLPGQLPAWEMQTLPGTGYLSGVTSNRL